MFSYFSRCIFVIVIEGPIREPFQGVSQVDRCTRWDLHDTAVCILVPKVGKQPSYRDVSQIYKVDTSLIIVSSLLFLL